MTYQQYKAELLCIKHLRTDIQSMHNLRVELYQMASCEINECSCDGYSDVAADYCAHCQYLMRQQTRLDDELKKSKDQLSKLRAYRSSLAHWFWNSRLGVPPGLR